MKFTIITFGCKVNQYESNMMKEKMLHHNFCFTKHLLEADIIIINTCTVTNTADKKCLRTVKSTLKKYPNKLLVVCGCSSLYNQAEYSSLNINILLGNKDKSKIALLIEEYLANKENINKLYKNRDLEFEDMFINSYEHTRAFIKIEDGCDNFCSYCIIPYVRGSVRSKDFHTVLKEAEQLVGNGHKEIVLTGIHTGRYYDQGHDLCDLIKNLEKINGLERIRISSIEITELNDKFLNLLKTSSKLCDHLHIPLQAGSDEILEKMNRKYNIEYYLNKVKEIRKIRPNISLTTDIIVGHPYETEELFASTLKVAKQIEFSKIHVFPFSKREGTKAAKMDGQVSEIEKKDRVKRLMNLSNELEESYYNKFRGQELDVLIEVVKNNKSYGHTSNYLYVEIPEKLIVNEVYKKIL